MDMRTIYRDFYVLRTNPLPTAYGLKILNTAYQRGEGVTFIASSVVIISLTNFTIYLNVCGCTLCRPVTYRLGPNLDNCSYRC